MKRKKQEIKRTLRIKRRNNVISFEMNRVKNSKAGIVLLLLFFFVFTPNFSAMASYIVGVKKGDWVKYDVDVTNPVGYSTATAKMEVLDVNATSLTIHVTKQMSDGEESSQSLTGDVTVGVDVWVIPANLTSGNSFNAPDLGIITIDGESTKTYAGASRKVVRAYILRSNTTYNKCGYEIYWDKQTGVAVEIFSFGIGVYYREYLTYKATETNMWQAEFDPTLLYAVLAAIIAIGAAGAIIFMKRRKKPPITQPSPQVQSKPSAPT